MEIVFYCDPRTNSHIFCPPDVMERGVGAAELMLIDLASELARQGHDVSVYNSCPDENEFDGVKYFDVDRFDVNKEYQVFVLHRNPTPILESIKAQVKLFQSTDQQTSGDYKTQIYPFVDAVTAISPYHKWYFVNRYQFDPAKIHVFDIGVRIPEYLAQAANVDKVPYRLIYTSTPMRGLRHLAKIFPAIRFLFPQAELYITAPSWGFGLETQYHPDTELFKDMEGVYFLGKLPREQLVELQLSADILAYPYDNTGIFGELFCVACAEAEVAGAVPITTRLDALATTVMPPARFTKLNPTEEGYVGAFLDEVTDLFSNNRLKLVKAQNELSAKAQRRFDWNKIGKQWLAMVDTLIE